MTDLKPCPFCGDKEAIRLTSWGLWRCWCAKCLVKTAAAALNGFEISALGKTVFLTREAAEAALKEMEAEHDKHAPDKV